MNLKREFQEGWIRHAKSGVLKRLIISIKNDSAKGGKAKQGSGIMAQA